MTRTSNSSVIVIVVMLGLALSYALYMTRPTEALVESKITQLSGTLKSINPDILNSEAVTLRESLQIFGTRPVEASSGALNRRNPFDGL